MNPFSRTQFLLGSDAMEKLKKARVAVFGLGGVGGYVAEALVRKGVPFRHAHHKVGALVKYAQDKGKPLDKVTLAEMKKVFPEADASMKKLFSPEHAVAGREIPGGTGFQAVRGQLDKWKKIFEKNCDLNIHIKKFIINI